MQMKTFAHFVLFQAACTTPLNTSGGGGWKEGEHSKWGGGVEARGTPVSVEEGWGVGGKQGEY